MLFTPKKRGRDWHWFTMVLLYAFSLLFGASVIWALLSFEIDLAERLALASLMAFTALVCWKLGRSCAAVVARMDSETNRH